VHNVAETPAERPLEPSAQALLDAVIAMSGELDLRTVLARITRSACELAGARYGALGVIGPDGNLGDLITHGIDEATAAHIPEQAKGLGVLRMVIDRAEPIRVSDVADHPAAHGFPVGHPPMRSFLGVPVRIRDEVFGNLYLAEKAGGSEFTEQDERLVVALARAAGTAIETARAFGLSERRGRWLEAAAELTTALQPPLEHSVALDRICRTVLPLTGGCAVVVGTVSAGGRIAAVVTRRPEDESDVRRAMRRLPELLPHDFTRPADLQVDGYCMLAVPLRSALAGRGAIVTFHRETGTVPGVAERDLFAGFAEQAGLALDRVRAIDDRADLAVVTDRERIARDLHDVVIQRLFATGLQLQALGRTSSDPTVTERLGAAVDALDLTIKDVRGTIFELHNHDSGSLRAQVREVVREYVGGLGFTPVLRTTGPVDTAVPEHVRAHLLPVLREAVSNLVRHARATAAEIELVVRDDSLTLAVVDDGIGLPEPADVVESGLRNVRCRATQLGGSVDLTGRDPQGTVFCWRVPLTLA